MPDALTLETLHGARSVYDFRIIVTINSNYCAKQNLPFGLCNKDAVCFM